MQNTALWNISKVCVWKFYNWTQVSLLYRKSVNLAKQVFCRKLENCFLFLVLYNFEIDDQITTAFLRRIEMNTFLERRSSREAIMQIFVFFSSYMHSGSN